MKESDDSMPKGMIRMDDEMLALVSGGTYEGTVFSYTARRGDNIINLARRFSTTVDLIEELNPDVDVIGPGTRLILPLKG